jgi:hypothetical protein
MDTIPTILAILIIFMLLTVFWMEMKNENFYSGYFQGREDIDCIVNPTLASCNYPGVSYYGIEKTVSAPPSP